MGGAPSPIIVDAITGPIAVPMCHATSVYIMRLVDQDKIEQAGKFNGQAAKMLVVITVAMVVAQAFF